MKHNIRINGEVKEIDCELGTGILDKNGEEIFEGDTVKRYIRGDRGNLSEEKVVFHYGTFSTVRYGTLRPLGAAFYPERVND